MTRIAILLVAAVLVSVPPDAPADASTQQPSTALPASLPLRRDASAAPDTGSWAPSAILLALLGAGGAWLGWRRLGRAGVAAAARARPEPIVRLSSQALTPQASVHAVQWAGEELLLACTPQQVTVVSRRRLEESAKEQA